MCERRPSVGPLGGTGKDVSGQMHGHPQKVTCGDFVIDYIVTAAPFFENCYLLRHTPSGEQILIDPGIGADKILAKVRADGDSLREVWLTHGHLDHIGGTREVQAAMPVPCRAHADERPLIERQPDWGAQMLGVRVEIPTDCRYYLDEPMLAFAGAEARVIHTPGHTPGGVCYVFDGFAFTGDTLFQQGIGRTDFPGGDAGKLRASITRLLDEIPPETLLFSGHGGHWTAGEAKRWWSVVSGGIAFV